ncbi:hypothetical protein QBC39DRAFT_391563 [Podospora conica]|nr:hypothetical protein QBC39DRAFT_391563 [Schizothecium conicum]
MDDAAAAAAKAARAAEDNSTVMISVICVIWGLSLITACARFYTRAVLVRSFAKDDIFMVFAVLLGIGGLAAWIVSNHNGYGRHMDTIRAREWTVLLEAQFYQSVLEASFAFGFLKVSIALSLLRLSKGTKFRRILWTLIGFIVIYTLFSFITFMTWCQPISGQWNFRTKTKCYDKELFRDFGLFNVACNITTDILFASLPIPLIWSLQLQRRVRIYLIVILSGGYLAVGMGIAKAIFIIAYVHERDGTFWPFAPFFGSLQLHIGIIAACAPTLRPLLGTLLNISREDEYREANYYRAGKALDRIPKSGNNNGGNDDKKQKHKRGSDAGLAESGLLRHPGNTSPSPTNFLKGAEWARVNRGGTGFSARVRGGSEEGEKMRSFEEEGGDGRGVEGVEFGAIVKTVEVRVEK